MSLLANSGRLTGTPPGRRLIHPCRPEQNRGVRGHRRVYRIGWFAFGHRRGGRGHRRGGTGRCGPPFRLADKASSVDFGCVYVGCNGTVPQLLGHARGTSVYAATHVHEKHRRGGWLVGAGLAGWWSMGSYSRDTKQLTVAGHHRVASSFLFYLFLGGVHV